MSGRGDIRGRIDAALEKVAMREMQVRGIYLDEIDLAAFDRAASEEFGMPCHSCGYRGHILRSGKHSAVYSTHGVAVAVPKRLSRRVAVKEAA